MQTWYQTPQSLAFAAFADGDKAVKAKALAFQAVDDDHAMLQQSNGPLDPCMGQCISGKCVLAFPFNQPNGGCCRVLNSDDPEVNTIDFRGPKSFTEWYHQAHRPDSGSYETGHPKPEHEHDEEHYPHAEDAGYEGHDDKFKPRKLSSTVSGGGVCGEESRGGWPCTLSAQAYQAGRAPSVPRL